MDQVLVRSTPVSRFLLDAHTPSTPFQWGRARVLLVALLPYVGGYGRKRRLCASRCGIIDYGGLGLLASTFALCS
jgi:hypothetical protein